ncbi:hypothetical protein RZS08_04120, partial [Arthrospira platensis SPKY1]|nr:hypothetical protein [Arthrospira platensis SPKY1]
LDSLPDDKNNYLACLVIDSGRVGFSYLDLLDGVIKVIDYKINERNINLIVEKIQSIGANELIINNYSSDDLSDLLNIVNSLGIRCEIYKSTTDSNDQIIDRLLKKLGTHSLKGFGV